MKFLILISAIFFLLGCEARKPDHVLNEKSSSYIGDSLATMDANNNDTADVLELFLSGCHGDMKCAEDSALYYAKHPVNRPELEWWPFSETPATPATCPSGTVRIELSGARFEDTGAKIACYAENKQFNIYADTLEGTEKCFDKWEDLPYGISGDDNVSSSVNTLTVNGNDMENTQYIGAILQSCSSGKAYRVVIQDGILDYYSDTTGLFEEGDQVLIYLAPGALPLDTCFDKWAVGPNMAKPNAVLHSFRMPANFVSIRPIVNYCPDHFTDDRDGRKIAYEDLGTAGLWTQNLDYDKPDIDDSWCPNLSTDCAMEGRLYTHGAASGSCPFGWRLPTLEEFRLAEDKTTWSLSGYRMPSNQFKDFSFKGWYWTSSEFNTDMASEDTPEECTNESICAVNWIYEDSAGHGSRADGSSAMSVRCIRQE